MAALKEEQEEQEEQEEPKKTECFLPIKEDIEFEVGRIYYSVLATSVYLEKDSLKKFRCFVNPEDVGRIKNIGIYQGKSATPPNKKIFMIKGEKYEQDDFDPRERGNNRLYYIPGEMAPYKLGKKKGGRLSKLKKHKIRRNTRRYKY